MKRAIIVHGWGGSPGGHWLPWMRSTLQGEGWRAEVPTMPSPEHPQRDEWVRQLVQTIGHPDRDTFLVGHSLGCIAILRYLETLAEGERIGGTVLVAGFADPLGEGFEELLPFVSDPINWETVRLRCPRFAVVFSDDDPLVPRMHGETLATRLSARAVLIPGGKHLSGEDGRTTFTQLRDILLGMAGTA